MKDNQTSDFAFGNYLHFVNSTHCRLTYSLSRKDWELHVFEFQVSFLAYHVRGGGSTIPGSVQEKGRCGTAGCCSVGMGDGILVIFSNLTDPMVLNKLNAMSSKH